MKYQNIYGDLDHEITYITLAPYVVEFPKEDGKLNDDWKQVGDEFTLYLNK